MGSTCAIDDLANAVAAAVAGSDHPIVVGISGYGGAGKSTVARRMTSDVPGAYRLRGDDFLDPTRSHVRSTDWDGVERDRLVETVLRPFRERRRVVFQRFDWSVGRLGDEEELGVADALVVDAVGLVHPVVEPYLDLSVWIDVDADTATARGKARDRALGRNHDLLWDGVWAPNDRAFDATFDPRSRVDLIVPNP